MHKKEQKITEILRRPNVPADADNCDNWDKEFCDYLFAELDSHNKKLELIDAAIDIVTSDRNGDPKIIATECILEKVKELL